MRDGAFCGVFRCYMVLGVQSMHNTSSKVEVGFGRISPGGKLRDIGIAHVLAMPRKADAGGKSLQGFNRKKKKREQGDGG